MRQLQRVPRGVGLEEMSGEVWVTANNARVPTMKRLVSQLVRVGRLVPGRDVHSFSMHDDQILWGQRLPWDNILKSRIMIVEL